jgi:hypothetical protein
MSKLWEDNFTRSNKINIDDKFVYSIMTCTEGHARAALADMKYTQANPNDPKVFHPQLNMITKHISNYIYCRGSWTAFYHWTQDRDADVAYLQENLHLFPDVQEIVSVHGCGNIDYDWDNRVIRIHTEFNDIPRNAWLNWDRYWTIDGKPTGYETSDPNFETLCLIHADDYYGWTTKVCYLENSDIVYTKPNNVETYMFVQCADVTVNGTAVPAYSRFKVSSPELTINNSGADTSVIVIKEKLA